MRGLRKAMSAARHKECSMGTGPMEGEAAAEGGNWWDEVKTAQHRTNTVRSQQHIKSTAW